MQFALVLQSYQSVFTGGERVHQVFRQRADDKLLFDYVNDVSDTDYFTQNYVPSAERNGSSNILLKSDSNYLSLTIRPRIVRI